MRELILDANGWRNKDDVYDAFFRAVRAPEWHGRNFNALRDSIKGGLINEIEVPYRIHVVNAVNIGRETKQMLDDFRDLIQELAAEGCEVEIEIDG
jgi:RNAse (barnase) inhibitor barstar